MNILALNVSDSFVRAAVQGVESPDATAAVAETAYRPGTDGLEATHLWRALTEAARQAVLQSGAAGTARDVGGIGLSVFAPGLVLLDGNDRPLAPIRIHDASCSRTAARQAWTAAGPEFLADTGNRPLPGLISALSYRHMLHGDPYLATRVKSYLHLNGWLGFCLTGERAFDRGNACFTGLFGTLTDQRWSPRWCSYFEVEPAWLPPVICGSATLGYLRSAAAAELGVPAGIPVKLGTIDASMTQLAAGMLPGDLLHVTGPTDLLIAFADPPRASPTHLTRFLGVGDRFIHTARNPVGGMAFEWLRRLCFREQSEAEFYGSTIAAARERTGRVTFDPPFLNGDPLEIEACRAAFRDLEVSTDRLDLPAALLNAQARRQQEALADLDAGKPFDRILLTGPYAHRTRALIAESQQSQIQIVDEQWQHGVARLFASGRR